MLSEKISFLKEFIGAEWLDAEYERINTKSPLKGAAIHNTYHPWVSYIYEIDYLLNRARVKKHDSVIMGEYYHILENAGMLLKLNFDYIADKKAAQMMLRNPKQFYDFIWELETRTMLSQCGGCATFNNPQNGNNYDGSVTIVDRPIAFECKNKILDNARYSTNSIFTQVLASKLRGIASVKNKVLQVEFEDGRFEDIKTIIAIIRDKFDVYNYQSILGRYKVRVLKKIPFNIPSHYLMNIKDATAVFQIGTVNETELYLDNASSNTVITKLVVKMPDSINKLNNLEGVLKKANSQLSSGGVVFLQVPYETFEDTKSEISKMDTRCLSNIYAVKLVSVDIRNIEDVGVKISRLEDLITLPLGTASLSQKELDFFSQPMAFSKYVDKV